MSAKELLYGVVATVVPNCTGVDGGTYTGYIVQKSHFGGTVLGHSIKDVSFVPGDVVRIIQCGECLTYGGTDVPLHGWGFLPYSSACPSVLQIPEYSLVRDIETNPRHAATASLNWLCRKAGCIDKLYWPARITDISGSLVTVCDQFGDGAYQMPVSSDLSISDFSIGDYVLVYSPSSGEEVIGWWMMEQGAGAIITGTLSFTDMNNIYPGDGGVLVLRLENTSNKSAQDITVTFSNTPGAFGVALDGTTWSVGSMAPGEVQTHYINVVFKGIWPTVSGYAVNISVTDTSPKTTYIGETTLPFSIRQASFVFDWDCFSPCRVYAPSGVSTGYVGTLNRDTGGGVWKTFAVAYLQYAFPEPIGIFFELELDAYYGFEYGTAHVLSQGDGKNFKVIFEVSVNYISPHKYPTFDINVTSNILVINGFELLDEPPTEY